MENNKTYIAIHFTLKGQDFSDIKPVLEKIAEVHPGAILIHGFMSREDLAAKGITDTTVPDNINKLFPEQRAFFKDGEVRRRDLFTFAYDNKATVYVIGRVKEGVKEEVIQYLNAGMDVIFIRLDGKTETGPVVVTHEEANKLLGLNESMVDFGNYLLSSDRSLSGPVSEADIDNWIKYSMSHSFLNNKNTQNVEDLNTQQPQDGQNETTKQQEGGNGNENLSQGNGNEGDSAAGAQTTEPGDVDAGTSAQETGKEGPLDGGPNGSLDEGNKQAAAE